jgi:predicted nucleotide-binding protein (sugar kinase/HSP70/actin superfamily)
VLNIYENYPRWFAFVTNLGFRAQLAPRSSRKIDEEGLDSIPSESVCCPGKNAHGHIRTLMNNGVNFIFYPCVEKEVREDATDGGAYNWPIVTGCPDVIRNNVEWMRSHPAIVYLNAFCPLDHQKQRRKRLAEEFNKRSYNSRADVFVACDAA